MSLSAAVGLRSERPAACPAEQRDKETKERGVEGTFIQIMLHLKINHTGRLVPFAALQPVFAVAVLPSGPQRLVQLPAAFVCAISAEPGTGGSPLDHLHKNTHSSVHKSP